MKNSAKEQPLGCLVLSNMPERKFHLAFAVTDISASIQDYSERLGVEPVVIVKNEYALWRTDQLNFSIRTVAEGQSIGFRHMGWEDDSAKGMSESVDSNGLLWEAFTAEVQLEEILELWPDAQMQPSDTI